MRHGTTTLRGYSTRTRMSIYESCNGGIKTIHASEARTSLPLPLIFPKDVITPLELLDIMVLPNRGHLSPGVASP